MKLEPPKNEPVLFDMYGEEIFKEETYYVAVDGILSDKSLSRFVQEYVDELTAGEANEELREVMSKGEYEELIKEALFDWFRDNGFVKPFNMEMRVER